MPKIKSGFVTEEKGVERDFEISIFPTSFWP